MRNPDEISGSTPRSTPQSAAGVYRIGHSVIDPHRGYIRRPGSDDLYLRHQTFQVLVYLLTHRDRVVGKEELHRAIWGDVAVTDDAFVQCVSDIRRALGDDSREQRIIKTLPRQGYRFVGPVEAITTEATSELAVPPAQPPASVDHPQPPATSATRNWRGIATLVAAAVVIAAVVSTLRVGSSSTTTETVLTAAPGVRRVVVFYFENQSGTREYDWLRHGLADMVITGLSRSESVAVLSRQQLELQFERHGLDRDRTPPLDRALELARQSGADSIVMGSFGEIGGSVRFEARIHDARDGRLIGVESVVSAQPNQVLTDADLITLRVAGRLGVDPRATNAPGRLPEVSTTSLEAFRTYLMGVDKAQNADAAGAIRLFEEAITLDPQFAMAYARVGYAYAVIQSLPERAKPYFRKAFENASRLSEKDRLYILVWSALADLDYPQAIVQLNELVQHYPLEAEAWRRLGVLLNGDSRPEEAKVALQRGLVADPFDKGILNSLGSVYQALGRPDEAIAIHRRFTELAPNQANAYDSLGLSYQFAGRYAEAIETYQRAMSLDPTFEVAAIHLGNTYFQLGRFDDAVAAYRRYIETADYDQDRGRGYASIAWVEWRRGSQAKTDAAIARARQLSRAEPIEVLLIGLERGQLAGVKRQIQFLTSGPNRGRRVSRRIELFLKGEIALREGREADAIAHLRDVNTHPPIPFAMESLDDSLASALLRLRRFDESAEEYQRVLKANPNHAKAHYGLACALDQLGKTADAEPAYRRFLEIWRDADANVPELIEAKQRLAALGAGSTGSAGSVGSAGSNPKNPQNPQNR